MSALKSSLVFVLLSFLCVVSPGEALARAPLLWQIEGPRGPTYILGTFPSGAKWSELPGAVHDAFQSSQFVATEGLLPLAQERRQAFQRLVGQFPPPQFELKGPPYELFRLAIAPHLPSPLYMHPGFLVPLLDALGQRIIHQHFVSSQGRDILNYPDGMPHEILQLIKKQNKRQIWLEQKETPLMMQLKEWTASDVEVLLNALHTADARFFTSAELTTSHEGIRRAYLHGDLLWLREWVRRRGLIEGPVGRMYRRATLRHLSWLSWIESVIHVGNGFVAVDFTHLVGPDHNLISALKERGHRVELWGFGCQQELLPKKREDSWGSTTENSLPPTNLSL